MVPGGRVPSLGLDLDMTLEVRHHCNMAEDQLDLDEGRTKEGHRKRRKSKPASGPAAVKTNGQPAPEEEKSPGVTFFQRAAQLSEADWDSHKIYVYRRWPRISKSGEPHYIATYREPVDEEFVKNMHGSGRYKLRLNDPKRTVKETALEIMDLNSPPKLSADELIDCPENEKYHKLWPSGSVVKPADGVTAADGAAAAAVRGLSDLAETVLEQTVKKGDANSSSTVADLLRELKPYLPNPASAPAPAQPSVLEILTQVKQLQGDPLSMMEKLQKLMPREHERSTKEEADPLENLSKMFGVFKEARELFQPESAPAATAGSVVTDTSEMNGWQTLTSVVMQSLPSLVSSAATLVTAIRGGPAAFVPSMNAPPVAPPKPGPFNPYDQAAMRDFVRRQNAATAQASAPPGAAGSAIPMPPVTPAEQSASGDSGAAPPPADQGMLGDVAVLVNQALGCLNRGVDGHRYAAALIDINGDLSYDTIVEQIRAAGVPVIIQLAKTIPQVSQQATAYEVPLQRFIQEFLEGPEWPEDPEGDANIDDNIESKPESPRHEKRKQTVTVA